MEKDDKKVTQSEVDAEKAAAKDVMPRLLAQRDKLEREGGAFNRVERNHWARIAVAACVTLILAAYALVATSGSTEKEGVPVFPWVVTGASAIATMVMAVLWDKAKAARRREQDELSEKMRQVGRRIDSADRTMRR